MATLSDLKQDHKNARKRTQTSASLLQESLQRYGPARSIVIDEDNRILAGNGTVEAAINLGIDGLRIIDAAPDELIAVRRTGLSEDQKVGLALADNRTADLAEWDAEMLQQLSKEHDIAPWFEDDDVEALLEQVEKLDPVEGNTDPDEAPEPPTDPITKPGDLWILGNHRLLCGDSNDTLAVDRLLDGSPPDAIFTDPPYGIGIDGQKESICANSKHNRKAHAFKGWDADRPAAEVFNLILGYRVPTVIFGGNYFADLLPASRGWIYWSKGQDGLSMSDGELAWTSLNKVLRCVTVNRAALQGSVHPTQKPTEVVAFSLEYLEAGKVVLDLFGGSGTTLIVCEQTQRHARLMELDPAYCDVIVKRWEDFTGNTAICHPSDAHFAALCPPPADHSAPEDGI
jgi:16S rRNA G966 N2-methylase RsmD